jgi:hypothetical protein
MTKAAKFFGKEARFFMALDSTKEYLEALEQTVGKSHSLVETTMGRNGGTWGHPKLAVFFARWLDVKFAVFCDMVIDDIINKKAELVVTKPEESATALNTNATLTMSSREIAELTGKQHQHVKRDIESMLVELGRDASSFGHIYRDTMNRSQTEYLLPKDLTITLVSGYNVQMRYAITKHWMELEAQQALSDNTVLRKKPSLHA